MRVYPSLSPDCQPAVQATGAWLLAARTAVRRPRQARPKGECAECISRRGSRWTKTAHKQDIWGQAPCGALGCGGDKGRHCGLLRRETRLELWAWGDILSGRHVGRSGLGETSACIMGQSRLGATKAGIEGCSGQRETSACIVGTSGLKGAKLPPDCQ